MEKYFSRSQVIELLGRSRTTVRDYIKQGKLKATKVLTDKQTVYQIKETDIENFLGYPLEIVSEYDEKLEKEVSRIKRKPTPHKAPEEKEQLEIELAEIDKKIIGQKLHFLDRSKLLKKRKQIYETLHPETKKEFYWVNQYSKPCHALTYLRDAVEKLQIDRTIISREIQIADNLTPEVEKLIKEKNISKERTILLINVPPKKQVEILNNLNKKKKKHKTSTTIKIETEFYDKAKKFAVSQKMTLSKLLEILIDTFFKEKESQASLKSISQDKGQTIALNEIQVPRSYSRLPISEEKIQKIIDFYKEHGRLDKPLTVLKEIILTDGYKRYVAATELGLTEVPVNVTTKKESFPPIRQKKIKKKPIPAIKGKKKPRTAVPLIEKDVKGKIKRVVPGKGFGFISGESGKEYFFHHSGLKGIKIDDLEEWFCVKFDVIEGQQGLQAVNIKQDLP